MPKPKFFCFYESYGQAIGLLSDEQAGRLIKGMYTYFFQKKKPQLKGEEALLFSMISFQMHSDRKKYDRVCERNRKNIQSRWHKEGKDEAESNDEEEEAYETVPVEEAE